MVITPVTPLTIQLQNLQPVALSLHTAQAVIATSPLSPLDVVIPSPQAVTLTAIQAAVRSGTETYKGAYTFTPSQQTQTIDIAGKQATQNITINPIPSNYGLITWNGATLTVS